MFSNHNGFKLEVNNKKISEKSSNIWKLNNAFLNNPWAKEEIKKAIRKYFEMNKNEITTYQYVWDSANVVLGGKLHL